MGLSRRNYQLRLLFLRSLMFYMIAQALGGSLTDTTEVYSP